VGLEAAKVMKPCSELNLGGKVDLLQWVLFCFEGCSLGFGKEVRWFAGAAEGVGR
jgi:hypothetical protein